MFFFLSKTITYLILPVPLLAICLLVFLLVRRRPIKKLALIAFTSLFFLFTNPFIANQLMQWWEVPATPLQAFDQPHELAVILTGVTAADREPQDRVHLQKGADRIMHTLQLYKLGLVEKILISGGSGKLMGEAERAEAAKIKEVLLLSGMAEEDIRTEERSRNTHENALYTAEWLEENNMEDHPFLLVTSAFHMRRSMGCFRQAGLHPIPYSTDFYSDEQEYTPDSLFIPSEEALVNWTKLIKEWVGYIMYDAMGYL
ncbi:YdcF family protein [Nafulsella turpanensis]|uniref:YdcF family protein n=1 Tax=Nafulsella turpanensis TaxID=1265690 RepID=UPI00034BC369|nr:YdcF family protein [Nafulsella turpanensis]